VNLMRKWYPLILAVVILFGATACRSKKELALLKPGETEVWQTVNRGELRQYAQNLPHVELETTLGTIVIELFDDQAPVSVANFLDYVESGFYVGTIFHRVEPGMVVQGGGYTATMERKETNDPIINEAGNGLRNLRGTVGVARTQEMASGTSQFYVNLVDNPGFNGNGRTSGYAVFGRIYSGMDVIDTMATLETGRQGGLGNVPIESVIITSAKRLR
jgi:peptidyl-prolyl cis-trans isomerase A (cyclophilin A)